MSRTAVVLLAFLLLFSNNQCVIACASAPCHAGSNSNLPPCHRHHAPANDVPQQCSHSLTAVNTNQSGTDLVTAGLVTLPVGRSLVLWAASVGTAGIHSPPPPGLPSVLPDILRI